MYSHLMAQNLELASFLYLKLPLVDACRKKKKLCYAGVHILVINHFLSSLVLRPIFFPVYQIHNFRLLSFCFVPCKPPIFFCFFSLWSLYSFFFSFYFPFFSYNFRNFFQEEEMVNDKIYTLAATLVNFIPFHFFFPM